MGQLLEKVIRRKGLNISELCRAVGVNRRTMYIWFQKKDLKVEILEKLSSVMSHDFSAEFPKVIIKKPDASDSGDEGDGKDEAYWKDKYILLLERYAELLTNHRNQKQEREE